MELGDVIGELEYGTPKKEYNGGGVLVEEPCGDDISLADSDKDDVFTEFSFLQASRLRDSKINVVNPSLIILDRESMLCTLSNASLVEIFTLIKKERVLTSAQMEEHSYHQTWLNI